jgi:uncharacterized phage protein (TIGR02218 family)
MTLEAHLSLGVTTVARCWAVTRRGGATLGFTDHDRALSFEGIEFRPETGLSAAALVQGTGLAVDNSEVLGALSDAAISEADLDAGRWDGAELRLWHVNWADPASRRLRFRGTLGEVRRQGGGFAAELRGLAEPLNRPLGRLYGRGCQAVLGDGRCRVDLARPGLVAELPAGETGGRLFAPAGLEAFPPRWFERGRLRVVSGRAIGQEGIVKHDRSNALGRRLELWAPLRLPVAPDDLIRLEPGCDKTPATCRVKFDNIANFQGFPFIPGEDWLLAVPRQTGLNDGGPLA